MDSLRSKINVVNPITLEVVPNPSATHAKVSQDEKAHHSNDTQARYISCVEYHTYYNQNMWFIQKLHYHFQVVE